MQAPRHRGSIQTSPTALVLSSTPQDQRAKAITLVATVSTDWDTDGGEVWSVINQWTDITSEAGLAWSANSGLNWNEKYQAWVTSLEVQPLEEGYIKETFLLTTPHGRAFTAPVLECAEVAIFMRAAFAAWYNLPFYLEAYDRGQPIYLGHFGFRNADGSLFSRTPFAYLPTIPKIGRRANGWRC